MRFVNTTLGQANPRAQLNRDMSARGIGSIELYGENGAGNVTKLLIGQAANATVLTLEQQPGHEAHAYLQEAAYRADFLDHGWDNLGHRPSGPAYPVSLELAAVIVVLANKSGNLLAGQRGVEAVTNLIVR